MCQADFPTNFILSLVVQVVQSDMYPVCSEGHSFPTMVALSVTPTRLSIPNDTINLQLANILIKISPCLCVSHDVKMHIYHPRDENAKMDPTFALYIEDHIKAKAIQYFSSKKVALSACSSNLSSD